MLESVPLFSGVNLTGLGGAAGFLSTPEGMSRQMVDWMNAYEKPKPVGDMCDSGVSPFFARGDHRHSGKEILEDYFGEDGEFEIDSSNIVGTEWDDLTDAGNTILHTHNIYAEIAAAETITGLWTFSRGAAAPFAVAAASNVRVANLNADLLDGYEGAQLAALAENEIITGAWTVTQGTFTVRNATDTGAAVVEVGTGGSGNRYALLDLTGDATYTDFGDRFIRDNRGANSRADWIHEGTGHVRIKFLDTSGRAYLRIGAGTANTPSDRQAAGFTSWLAVSNTGLNLYTRLITGVTSLAMSGQFGTPTSIAVAEDAWVGIGAALERLVFDGSGGTIDVLGANLDLSGNTILGVGGLTLTGNLTMPEDGWIGITGPAERFVFDGSGGIIEVQGAHMLFAGTNQAQFGDSGTYINQGTDGHLDLTADVSIDLNGDAVFGTATDSLKWSANEYITSGAVGYLDLKFATGTRFYEGATLLLTVQEHATPGAGVQLRCGTYMDLYPGGARTLTIASSGLLCRDDNWVAFRDANARIECPDSVSGNMGFHATGGFYFDNDIYVDNIYSYSSSPGDLVNIYAGVTIGSEDAASYAEFEADGSQVFVGTAGLPYAGLSVTDNAVETTVGTAGVFVQFLGFDTNSPSNNCTPDHTNDHITIVKAGVYAVIASICITSTAGGAADHISFELRKNNGTVTLPGLKVQRKLAGGGDDIGSISMSGEIDVAAADTIELWLTDEDNADNVLIADANLAIFQLGGT